jgi:hypothetical protein
LPCNGPPMTSDNHGVRYSPNRRQSVT